MARDKPFIYDSPFHELTGYTKLHAEEEHQVSYIEQYDAHFCFTCLQWIEPKCSDISCVFCSSRPRGPGDPR